MRILLAFVLCAFTLGAGAQVYRWTDEQGRVHITDTPPPKSAKGVKRDGGGATGGGANYSPAPAAEPKSSQQEPFALQQAKSKYPVTLYTIPNCEGCNQARRLLNARGVPFKENSLTDAAQMDDYLYGIVPAERGSDEWIELVGAAAADFGEACSDETGELLGQVDTVSAARDLDLLRAILGDEQLNYLGYSYGTFLGATYADLYPDLVGRVVLDGAIDPSSSDAEVTEAQAVGFEQALRAYLEDCVTGTDCPFDGTVDDGMAEVSRLLAVPGTAEVGTRR